MSTSSAYVVLGLIAAAFGVFFASAAMEGTDNGGFIFIGAPFLLVGTTLLTIGVIAKGVQLGMYEHDLEPSSSEGELTES